MVSNSIISAMHISKKIVAVNSNVIAAHIEFWKLCVTALHIDTEYVPYSKREFPKKLNVVFK